MGRARDIRLLSDYQKISDFTVKHPFVSIKEVVNMPPVAYLLEFALKGYVNSDGEIANSHTVSILLPEQYPFSAPPKFVFTNGLFHPNVYKNGDVCHGWYLHNWHPGIHIDDLLLDIAKIICFKPDSYNLKSPANFACDADWIAAHTIPADDTPLTIAETTIGKMVSLPTVQEEKSAESPVEPEIEQNSTSPIRVKIRAIRNILTRSGKSI